MTRVKRGTTANARRKRLLKHAKGFMWTRSTKYRQAKEALLHAWSFQFADRKKKKRNFRRLWQIKINAAARDNGLSYSKLINKLLLAKVELDRKILAELAEKEPEIFKKLIQSLK
jgi:large subunit ribosomal protein L20